MEKLEFTTWFEVNPTFCSRNIAFRYPKGPIPPPPRGFRDKDVQRNQDSMLGSAGDKLSLICSLFSWVPDRWGAVST